MLRLSHHDPNGPNRDNDFGSNAVGAELTCDRVSVIPRMRGESTGGMHMTIKSALFTLALPLAIVACGGGTPEAEAPEAESTEAPASESAGGGESSESSEAPEETPSEGSSDAPAE